MTPQVYKDWNKIEDQQISDQGHWVSYRITNESDRSDLTLYDVQTGAESVFPHARSARFTADEKFFVFLKGTHPDTLKALKRKKVKKSKLPKDTLGIMNLQTRDIQWIPEVKSYHLPKEGAAQLSVLMAPKKMKKDSTLVKNEGKKNGSKLQIMDLNAGTTQTIGYVTAHSWSENGHSLLLHTTGQDSTAADEVVLYTTGNGQMETLMAAQGKYSKLTLNHKGDAAAFMVNQDTTEQKKGKEQIMVWKQGQRQAKSIASPKSTVLPKGWVVSTDRKPVFMKENDKLLFGIRPLPPEKDTSLLDEEIVDLEIWHHNDGYLQPQQHRSLKRDLKSDYLVSHDLKTGRTVQVTDEDNDFMSVDNKMKGQYYLTTDNKPYRHYSSWLGHDYKDVYLIDTETGAKRKILSRLEGTPRLSPNGEMISWYTASDTTWNAMVLKNGQHHVLTKGGLYDELNDRPMHPRPSGTLGWTSDNALLLYDHYDIWRMDGKPQRLTMGREANKRYRHVRLDRDLREIPADTTLLIRYVDEDDMSSGYAYLDLQSGAVRELASGPYNHSGRVLKAKNADVVLYTKQSFELFPDLIVDNLEFSEPKVISDANPQQSDYAWGSIELYHWTDEDGHKRKALLAKPAGFDPGKKYPLIMNFYEKSSTRLHSHRAPYAHRSTINYTYYLSKGYVIFNPDIYYKDGYPGKSCEDAVMTSLDALLKEGFIDEDRMALQGHSWGGYQIAHLLTKTDRFVCAESGAPVVNMVSAYGGIRWGTGRSRMFQYERTQSRLGHTLWERPDLYLDNSPIFNMDKVNTPVLILHNDADGAVPWYQGIEYFVALRRLGKPAWMLNYRDEPHWPVKRQNRMDFNIRMEQFFDHYLMGGEMPVWMKEGVPAVDQGIRDGLEYDEYGK